MSPTPTLARSSAARRAVLRRADADGLRAHDDWAPGAARCCRRAPLAPAVARAGADASRSRSRASHRRDARRASCTEADIVRLFAARGGDFDCVCQRGRRAARERRRRRRPLRRQPQHQLHQHLRLPLRLLRLLQGQDQRRTCAAGPTTSISPKSRAAPTRPGSAARPKSACRAASIPTIPARPISPSAAPSRRRCRACTFTPSRRWRSAQGATTLGLSLRDYLARLQGGGARHRCPARRPRSSTTRCAPIICPDKLNTAQWLDVIEPRTAVGLRTTATIMFGHVERAASLGAHLLRAARPAGANRRLHRVRAAALRAAWRRRCTSRATPPGTDLPRGRADARRRPAGAASADPRTSRRPGSSWAARAPRRASTPAPTISAAR